MVAMATLKPWRYPGGVFRESGPECPFSLNSDCHNCVCSSYWFRLLMHSCCCRCVAVVVISRAHIIPSLLWELCLWLVCSLVNTCSRKSDQYIQACMTQCLWRPMPMILIIGCLLPSILCDGKAKKKVRTSPVFVHFLVSGFVTWNWKHMILWFFISPFSSLFEWSTSHRHFDFTISRNIWRV